MSEPFEPDCAVEPSREAIQAAQQRAFLLARIGYSCRIGYGQMLLNNMDSIIRAAYAHDFGVRP